jgi:hypothetical protein
LEEGVATAPTPLNRRFSTLDEYLAFREKGAAIGKAWYRELRPGIYRLEAPGYRGSASGEQIFTREQLLLKFGFSR